MIAYLEGQPKIIGTTCIILVRGVGYQVEVTTQTLEWISLQDSVALFIHTHVREDALDLFGFVTADEKKLFQSLLTVSGVGPRSALALTGLGTSRLITAVQEADTTVLMQAPRVGKKLAQKIIIDLKSKLGSLKEIDLTPPSPAQQEIIVALTGMGFDEEHIRRALQNIDIESVSIEVAIKQTLQSLGSQS